MVQEGLVLFLELPYPAKRNTRFIFFLPTPNTSVKIPFLTKPNTHTHTTYMHTRHTHLPPHTHTPETNTTKFSALCRRGPYSLVVDVDIHLRVDRRVVKFYISKVIGNQCIQSLLIAWPFSFLDKSK